MNPSTGTRILGIDYGEKRIGVAISDDSLMYAVPHSVHEDSKNFVHELTNIIKDEEVGKIVVGRPRNMNGELGHQAQISADFAKTLDTLGLPVHLEDETASTAVAVEKMKLIGMTPEKIKQEKDMYAAAVILQGYLDSRR